MSRMFANYHDSTADCAPQRNMVQDLSVGPLKVLTDIKNRIYGIEARYQMPFTLYIHLEEAHAYDLSSLLAESTIEFSLQSKSKTKPDLSKVFKGKEIFNPYTYDLKLDITQEEACQLKQEIYGINIKLSYPAGFYNLFSGQDGLLIVR